VDRLGRKNGCNERFDCIGPPLPCPGPGGDGHGFCAVLAMVNLTLNELDRS
jgi:hypothetical protein